MRFFIVLASLASFLVTVATDPFINFDRSCTNVHLSHNFFLGATCWYADHDHVEIPTENELDLTMCIGLDQATGQMQWEVYGKFSNYCTNCTVHTATLEGTQGTTVTQLTCACKPLVGGYGFTQSTINLDEGIANDWGTLKCEGGMATLPHGEAV